MCWLSLLACASCKFDPPADVEAPSDGAPIDAVGAPHLVEVRIRGAGSGTVMGTSRGNPVIECGTDCQETVPDGSLVVLTAMPAADDLFFQWTSGPCAGSSDPTCMLTATAATTVDATFDRCARSTQTCTDSRFTECSADGDFVALTIPNGGTNGESVVRVMDEYQCPMGCAAAEPRCADIEVRNAVSQAFDSPQVSPTGMDVVIPKPGSPAGTVLLATASFDAAMGEIRITDTDGATIIIPAALADQPSPAPDLVVLKVRTFTVRAGSTLRIDGRLDLSADRDASTPGSGAGSSQGSVCSAGAVGDLLNPPIDAAGGGHAGQGGASSRGAAGGRDYLFGDGVRGGCGGGNSGNGGGAVQLASRTRLALGPTGVIDVNGGRGSGAGGLATGGGSGGGVLLQAPDLSLAPGSIVAGRGGSGGAGGGGGAGAHGQEGNEAVPGGVPGGTCSGCGIGGRGGTETTTAGNGTGTLPALGGGGGGVGRCVTATRTGTPIVPSGTMRIVHAPRVLMPRSP